MATLSACIPRGQHGHSASWSPHCAQCQKGPSRAQPGGSVCRWPGLPGGGRATCQCPSTLTLCSPQILVHIGFLTEESGDVFSPRVLKGGPLGEMVQWADILATLYVLGHSLRITVSLKELQR